MKFETKNSCVNINKIKLKLTIPEKQFYLVNEIQKEVIKKKNYFFLNLNIAL